MSALRKSGSALAVLFLSAARPVWGQWTGIPAGKMDLAAAAPVAADGKPDLSGLWVIDAKGFSESLGDYGAGAVPMREWARSLVKERQSTGAGDVPTARCLPPGIPMLAVSTIAHRMKIVQQHDEILVLYEYFGTFRQIFLDGRRPLKDANPTWMGYSTGLWEGNDLVIRTSGFNGKFWLDTIGHPATEALRLTERFHRPDFDHLSVQMTIDDPRAYTKPWPALLKMHLAGEGDLIEYVCNENERDAIHSR